ncbi:MAG TPA: hypothetical protein VLD61_00260 [Methylomirabilota bacterium]|nr:hypothetical protein [Methylomirabilota bacterium]
MSPTTHRAALALALFVAAACGEDHPAPTAPGGPAAREASDVPDAAVRRRAEALTRLVARGLADSVTRAAVHRALASSRVREGKVHFQRLLAGPDRRLLQGLARANGVSEAALRAEADAAVPLELYLPVAAHRAAWAGGTDYLVATAFADAEAPVAFDPTGRRLLLSPVTPPDIPVLALVPVETDFDRAGVQLAECADWDCGGGDGGGTADGGGALPSLANQHLTLNFSQFKEKFESWLKGDPEFELHVLAPNGKDTTAYKSLQCVGEHAPSGYSWDTNATTWYGTAQVLTGTQMDAYETQWPGKAWMIMALEDDDTACEIKMNRDLVGEVLEQLDDLYRHYKGLKDKKVTTPEGAKRIVDAATTTANLFTSVASLIKTNDELIGFAIRDSVAVKAHPVGNYVLLRDGAVNGWLRLDVKY